MNPVMVKMIGRDAIGKPCHVEFNAPVLTSYENYGFCGAMPKPYQKDELERVLGMALNF